jgi:hypothetical protein
MHQATPHPRPKKDADAPGKEVETPNAGRG